MRIIVAEDSVLFREGIVRLLTEAGHEVVATVGDAESLVGAVDGQQADLLIVDVRMPPGMKDDGALAAQQLRMQYPHLSIVLLSQHVETRHVLHLVATGSFGYLLKDRVLRVDDFLDAPPGRWRRNSARPGHRAGARCASPPRRSDSRPERA